MKPYFVFGGRDEYASGPMGDFDSLEEAVEHCRKASPRFAHIMFGGQVVKVWTRG